MLRKEAVEKGTMDLVGRLMSDQKLTSFNLVDGTALALMIVYRKSIDIDLFSDTDFNSQALSNHITSSYNESRIQTIMACSV